MLTSQTFKTVLKYFFPRREVSIQLIHSGGTLQTGLLADRKEWTAGQSISDCTLYLQTSVTLGTNAWHVNQIQTPQKPLFKWVCSHSRGLCSFVLFFFVVVVARCKCNVRCSVT